jgi:heat shock protein HtpX
MRKINWLKVIVLLVAGLVLCYYSFGFWYQKAYDMLAGEPVKPDWYPDTGQYTRIAHGNYYDKEHSLLIIPFGKEWKGKIIFEGLPSYGGFWSAYQPTLIFSKPYGSTLKGKTVTGEFRDTLPSGLSTSFFRPYMEVAFPVGKEFYHQVLTADASMDVEFPEDDYYGFTVAGEYMERTIRFFVVSPAEMKLVRRLAEPCIPEGILTPYLKLVMSALGIWLLLLAVLTVFNVKPARQRSKKTSDHKLQGEETGGRNTADPTVRICKKCGNEIRVDPGYVVWCDKCNWNINPYCDDCRKSILEKLYDSLGEILSKNLYQKLHRDRIISRSFTLTKVCAFLFSTLLYAANILLIVSIFLLFIFLYKLVIQLSDADISIRVASGVILTVLFLAFAYFFRPRFPKAKSDRIQREEYPYLFKICDQIADKLRTPRIDDIVLTDDYNAFYTEEGIRKCKVLGIGLPLFSILDRGEKVALLSHELSHSLNKDVKRGRYIGGGLNLLAGWYDFINPIYILAPVDTAVGPGVIIVILVNMIRWCIARFMLILWYLLSFLLFRDSQRAEYYADHLAAKVCGTDATISLLEKLHYGDTFFKTIQSMADYGYSGNLFSQMMNRIVNIPIREKERIRRLMTMDTMRVDSTHPPTVFRIEMLKSESQSGSYIINDFDFQELDRELVKTQADIGRKLISRCRADNF